MRKGQITIFITIAVIIILLGFAILFIYTFPSINKESVSDVKSFVEQCIKDTSTQGLNLMFLQGGYIYPSDYLETPYQKISYELPDKSTMETQLNSFITQALPKCFNASYFEQYGYQITYRDPIVNTQINDNVILANVNFPVTIQKGAKISEVSSFITRIDVRFSQIYNTIKELREQKEWFDLKDYDAEVDIIAYDDSLIISVTDTKSYINTDYFRFVTAVKFT